MQSLFVIFEKAFRRNKAATPRTPAPAQEMQVVVPDAVVLPLPKAPREEICVPASINGRDLSTGRL
jgi:hypothetical protein